MACRQATEQRKVDSGACKRIADLNRGPCSVGGHSTTFPLPTCSSASTACCLLPPSHLVHPILLLLVLPPPPSNRVCSCPLHHFCVFTCLPVLFRYFAQAQDDEFVYLALFYCPLTLDDYVKNNGAKMLPNQFKNLLKEIIDGVAHLHSLNIVHRYGYDSPPLVTFSARLPPSHWLPACCHLACNPRWTPFLHVAAVFHVHHPSCLPSASASCGWLRNGAWIQASCSRHVSDFLVF